jgi:hypothetical protein
LGLSGATAPGGKVWQDFPVIKAVLERSFSPRSKFSGGELRYKFPRDFDYGSSDASLRIWREADG